jgi:YegS/Rv2252/BmrU family lipid kinase
MPAKVILNPYSNRWNAQKRWPEAEAALHAAGVDFELAISERPKGAVELAAQAAKAGFSPVIAAGGDGTIGDVVNGLAQMRGEADMGILGILPLGTANDLPSTLGIPLDLNAAARVIAAGNIRRIDVGNVNGSYFANNSAIGLEPYVTTKQVKITWIKGIPRYLVAAVQGILDHPTWKATVEWDGGHFEGPISLVSIGNGPRTGGLFFMSPHADPSDGKLTFVVGYRATRLSTFAILPKTMSPAGTFVHEPGIQEVHATWLKIRLDHPSPAHTDGELFSDFVTELDYRIISGCLRVLVP